MSVTCRFMYNHAFSMNMCKSQLILENYWYWHKQNTVFMLLILVVTNFGNYVKLRNVSPSYSVIPCLAFATLFGPFLFTAFHIFNKHWIFKHFDLQCLSYYCHLIHLSFEIWNEIIAIFLFWLNSWFSWLLTQKYDIYFVFCLSKCQGFLKSIK